ncbi:MAG: MFS transporter [Bacillota bacterium]
MKSLFSRKNKSRNLYILYLLGMVLAIANALPAYIQSNYLGSLFSITWISIFFLVANLAAVIAIIFYPKIISKTGNSVSTETVLLLFIVSLLGLSVARNIWGILLSFIALSVSTNLIWINMDILVEKFSDDASTGTTRTIYFTAINLGWIIAPALSSFLITGGNYYWVFLAAAIFLVPFFALLIGYRQRFKDSRKYRTDSTRKTLASFINDPDLRGAYMLSLLLNIFYSSAVVYIPIYLHQHLGFAWTTLGLMFSIMLIPFILFEIPAGYIADKKIGEKELLATGLTIVIISLFFFFTYRVPDALWWGALLFMSRIGAALIEAMRESYFFKKVGASDIPLINFFRTTAPLGYLIGTGMAALVFLFYPLQYLFIFVALAMASGYIFLHGMADSR